MKFYSKARTLKKIKLKKSCIPKLIIINCLKYKKNKFFYLNKIKTNFVNNDVAIRSSFNNEDMINSSNAGKYKSFLNLNPSNYLDIDKKINLVLESKNKINKNDEIFIQEMINDVKFSGVILTRNLENFSKSININYYEGNNTQAVTSGQFNTKLLTYLENEKYSIPKKFKKLYQSIKEISIIFKKDELDVEFAVGKNNTVYIFQVRKLIIPKKYQRTENQLVNLKKLEKKIIKLKMKHHDLLGNTTFFGNMPDWNPAEIIGTKPKPLALSLYQELITDSIWSQNRAEYGYRNLNQFRLMTTFFGTPYVDIRIDFNSWIPKKLNEKISKKLINYYLNKFKNNTDLHDKVEFEILFTCFTFLTSSKIKKNLKNILTEKEIKKFINSLKEINKSALTKIKSDLNAINLLKEKQKIIKKSNLYEIDKIYWLIATCKKYGTLPFAGLARCGFIGIEILNSMTEKNIISKSEKEKFLSNVKTITSQIRYDHFKLNKKSFIEKYGHLRPGTYEITNLNYKDGYKKYFNSKKIKIKSINKIFKLSKKIDTKIKKLKIYKNQKELFQFIKMSIQSREYSKFIFSKSIDMIFENLIKFGKKYNISVENLSFIKISKLLEMYLNLSNIETIKSLKKHIKENKIEYKNNKNINLPDVIISERSLYIQSKVVDKINFITNKNINSKIIIFNEKKILEDYNGIVCIDNADPGFDFLFTKNIKGLITKYGGLNSHMAIRCSELNIPALIGVGAKNYEYFKKFRMMYIDCFSKLIKPIS